MEQLVIIFSFLRELDYPRIWDIGVSVGPLIAAFFAYLALRQSNMQLKVEQTPYVVVQHVEKKPSEVKISIRNVGRGPALHITCSKSSDHTYRNEAFFRDTQPHSVNLASGGGQEDWIVDRTVFDSLTTDSEEFKHLYVFYESQLRFLYRTDVKIKDVNEERGAQCYVVMENRIEDLGVR